MSKSFETLREEIQVSRNKWEIQRDRLYVSEQALIIETEKKQKALEKEGIPTLSAPNLASTQALDQRIEALTDRIQQIKELKHRERVKLEALEQELDQLGEPQQLIKELNDGLPFLLMPLRIETKLVQVKHYAKQIGDHIIDYATTTNQDGSDLKWLGANGVDWSGKKAWRIPTFEQILEEEDPALKSVKTRLNAHFVFAQGRAGKRLPKAVPDTYELWLRIYPDDVFVNAHEDKLLLEEKLDGQIFWRDYYWPAYQQYSAEIGAGIAEEVAKKSRDQLLLEGWSLLQNKYKPARALYIYKITQPESLDTTQAPKFTYLDSRALPWSKPLESLVMPDRFVVKIIYRNPQDPTGTMLEKEFVGKRIPYPLTLSQDPSNSEGNEDHPAGVDEEVQWMVDFEEAEKVGMALKIPIGQEIYQQSIEKVVVLGINLSDDEQHAKTKLEQLLDNHKYNEGGLSILPNGTPTNNFEKKPSGYDFFGPKPQAMWDFIQSQSPEAHANAWLNIYDGQQLTNSLGLDSESLWGVYGKDGGDIRGALAMNYLLWPATWGYYLEQFIMGAVEDPKLGFTAETLEQAFQFFSQYVSGRGLLPSIRIDQQPYSILTTTAYSKWESDQAGSFSDRLFKNVLRPLDNFWSEKAKMLKNLRSANLYALREAQEFVDILGLQASSQEMLTRSIFGPSLTSTLITLGKNQHSNAADSYLESYSASLLNNERTYRIKELLEGLSDESDFHIPPNARIFNLYLAGLMKKLPPNWINDHYSPEMMPLSPEVNYLSQLLARSFDQYQPEQVEGTLKNNVLLSKLAHQAMNRAVLKTAISLHNSPNKIIGAIDFEFSHLVKDHSSGEEQATYLSDVLGLSTQNGEEYLYEGNKYKHLQANFGQGTDAEKIAEHLQQKIGEEGLREGPYEQVGKMQDALACLSMENAGSLERLLTEHLDLCNYRLDAWMQGLANERLTELRKTQPTGLYLGAYGYLENLHHENKSNIVFREVTQVSYVRSYKPSDYEDCITPILDFSSFEKAGFSKADIRNHGVLYLGKDYEGVHMNYASENLSNIVSAPKEEEDNYGFMHVPSTKHGMAAAVLRSAYLNNQSFARKADGAQTDPFAINLNSERVRKALYLMEGIEHGQEIGELLGYQFERMMSETETTVGWKYEAAISAFRRRFPLFVEKQEDDSSEPLFVVNGLKLVEGFREGPNFVEGNFEQILLGILRTFNPGIEFWEAGAAAVVKKMIAQLSDHMDALSDLLLSESIFQVAKGNLNAAASSIKMFDIEQALERPEMIETPIKHAVLNHVVAIQFDTTQTGPVWSNKHSPRSATNPYLNHWIAQQLPAPEAIQISFSVLDEKQSISVDKLGIEPIDLLAFFASNDPFSEESAFCGYVKMSIVQRFPTTDFQDISINFQEMPPPENAHFSLLQIRPLINAIQALISKSQRLSPANLTLVQAGKSTLESYYPVEYTGLRQQINDILTKHTGDNLAHIIPSIELGLQALVSSQSEEESQAAFTGLQQLLMKANFYAYETNPFQLGANYTAENGQSLIRMSTDVLTALQQKKAQAFELLRDFYRSNIIERRLQSIDKMAQFLFGDHFLVSYPFEFNKREELGAYQAAINHESLTDFAGEFGIEEWFQGIAQVRPAMKAMQKVGQYKEALGFEEDNLRVAQLPFNPDPDQYHWLGAAFPPSMKLGRQHLSIAFTAPPGYQADQKQTGILVDQWTEEIPLPAITTSVAMHFDQPDYEAPQSLLLCVPPVKNGNWVWDDLMATITDTFAMAKKRALEPDQLFFETDEKGETQPNALWALLPAIVAPISESGWTPGINFLDLNEKPN